MTNRLFFLIVLLITASAVMLLLLSLYFLCPLKGNWRGMIWSFTRLFILT